jgi:hypothetical protein
MTVKIVLFRLYTVTFGSDVNYLSTKLHGFTSQKTNINSIIVLCHPLCSSMGYNLLSLGSDQQAVPDTWSFHSE